MAKTLSVVDDLLRGLDGLFRLVAVVERFELKRAAGNAAMTICFVEGRQDALAHALTQILRRSGERRDLAKDDLVVGNAVLGQRRAAEHADNKSERNSKLIAAHRRFLDCVAASRRARFFLFLIQRRRS